MPSRNVGSKRKPTSDAEVPAELAKREAQDRKGSDAGRGRAQSPVDSMHVDAAKKREQDNAQGDRRNRRK
jgi:hypothetical protein